MELLNTGRERMQCMEIIGGNRAINKSFEAAGLDIHVFSQPFQDSTTGGDIYFLTSCASGRISRFLLADVSGHGDAASKVATSLRDLMRDNVNRISQARFVESMNQEFSRQMDNSCFATAVVATFFEPTKSLTLSVAGHPHPLYYRAQLAKWVSLDSVQTEAEFENMPLGVVDATAYPQRTLETHHDDMFLLYTDAFIESMTSDQKDHLLGMNGVIDLLNEESNLLPSDVVPYLRDRVGALAIGNLVDDDASLLLGHFTERKVKLKDSLLAPVRMFGEVCDRTSLN